MRYKALSIVLIIFFSAISCNSISTSMESTSEHENISSEFLSEFPTDEVQDYMNDIDEKIIHDKEEKTNRVFLKAGNASYSEMITTKYSEDVIFRSSILFRRYNPLMSFQYYLYTIEEEFPVECLRLKDEKNAYSVYQTDEGGLVYCFYAYEASEWTLINAAYLKDSLTKSDFAAIHEGDTLNSIISIDSAFKASSEYLQNINSNIEFSIHLLKDGLIIIMYEEKNNSYYVKTITYYDDYKFVASGITYDYSILEQDYPG